MQFHGRIDCEIDNPDFWLFDNESAASKLSDIMDFGVLTCKTANIIRQDHLPKRGNGNGVDYDYCWRAVWNIRALIALGYKKIIFLDNDAYIVSQRMANYVRELKSGWVGFWIPKYNFPSAEFWVLCEDSFPQFLAYTNVDFMTKNGITMENDLPFTLVNRTFIGDRYGEDKIPQAPEHDFYTQRNLGTHIRFTS